MLSCDTCGAHIVDGADFCVECGVALPAEVRASTIVEAVLMGHVSFIDATIRRVRWLRKTVVVGAMLVPVGWFVVRVDEQKRALLLALDLDPGSAAYTYARESVDWTLLPIGTISLEAVGLCFGLLCFNLILRVLLSMLYASRDVSVGSCTALTAAQLSRLL